MNVEPTRCLSSQLTTQLMTFRNPHGPEDLWLQKPDEIDSYAWHIGKVIVTEIGVALLATVAIIETLAYSILCLLSLPTYIFTDKPVKAMGALLSSSGFTIYWNISNFLVLNPFCTDVPTRESFARYSMDHWSPSQAVKVGFVVAVLANIIITICTRFYVPIVVPVPLAGYLNGKQLRKEDKEFIEAWGPKVTHLPQALEVSSLSTSKALANQLSTYHIKIREGTKFFKDSLIDGVNEAIKKLILAKDQTVGKFLLARTIYLYVLGDLHKAPLPDFFSEKLTEVIKEHRLKFSPESGLRAKFEAMLRPYMKEDYEAFTSFLKNPPNQELKDAFKNIDLDDENDLKEELFITECWDKAVAGNGEAEQKAQEVSPAAAPIAQVA